MVKTNIQDQVPSIHETSQSGRAQESSVWSDIAAGIVAGSTGAIGATAFNALNSDKSESLRDAAEAVATGAAIVGFGGAGHLAKEATKAGIKGSVGGTLETFNPNPANSMKEIGEAAANAATLVGAGGLGRALKSAAKAVDDASRAAKDSGQAADDLTKDPQDANPTSSADAMKEAAAEAVGAAIGGAMAGPVLRHAAKKAAEAATKKQEGDNKKHDLKDHSQSGLNFVDEVMSTPKDVMDHFRRSPLRATAEAALSIPVLIIDAKTSKE